MDRTRLATVWLGGCSGCHMSFLDLDEFLIELAGKVELVYSPVVDMKEYPENVDVCLIEGAVCNEDNLELLHKIRQRTRVLVSFGDCAVTANVPAMRNQLGRSPISSTPGTIRNCRNRRASCRRSWNGCFQCTKSCT
jgi:NAD-reducing hydrogenase small subunit